MRQFAAAAMLIATIGPALAQPAGPGPSPAAQELIYSGEASSILGRNVVGPDGKVVGRVVDVLVDQFGQPRAALVDFGGFMGVGNRRIAVAWRALHFEPDSGKGKITLEMTVDQISQTPEYRPASKPVVVAAPPRTEPPQSGP